ncbi:hypothetical protein LP420_11845 [Massilia sp. B-10]|nr:hypothetical protein LP420_11845 [Massilia sp. B-10]
MVEFLVAALFFLVPLFLAVVIIGKFGDVQNSANQAAATRPGNARSGTTTQAAISARSTGPTTRPRPRSATRSRRA